MWLLSNQCPICLLKSQSTSISYGSEKGNLNVFGPCIVKKKKKKIWLSPWFEPKPRLKQLSISAASSLKIIRGACDELHGVFSSETWLLHDAREEGNGTLMEMTAGRCIAFFYAATGAFWGFWTGLEVDAHQPVVMASITEYSWALRGDEHPVMWSWENEKLCPSFSHSSHNIL